MLTSEGAALLLPHLRAAVEGGQLLITDGSRTAAAAIEAVEVVGDEIVMRATFGEDAANFEWASSSVIDRNGVVVDVEQQDLGRKAPGTIWTLNASLKLIGAAGE